MCDGYWLLRIQYNSCPVTRLGSIRFFYCFLGITIIRDELTMFPFSIVFFLPLNFLLIGSLSAVSNSFYNLPHSSPTISRSLLMHYPIKISVFPASISSPLSGHLLSLSVLLSPIFSQMTSPCTPHQFLLKTFLHSNLHFQFIRVSLISSLNSHDYSFQVFSREPGHSPVVSMLVPSFLVH